VGDKPLSKAGKVVDHRHDLLNWRAASKTKMHQKTEKQTVSCNKSKTREGSAEPALEKGGKTKK
jgi:hypothetical protein